MNPLNISTCNRPVYNFSIKDNPNRIPPTKISGKYKKWTAQALNKWKNKFKIHSDFNLVFIKGHYKRVGEYVLGTFKTPLILLYIDVILDDGYLDGIEGAFKITIYHELGHALCEYHRQFGIKVVSCAKEEDFVEELARRVHYNHKVHNEAVLMNNIIQLYR